MAGPKKINLGVFASGELPFPVVHLFKRNGLAVNLTGYTTFVLIEGPDTEVNYGQGVATITDAAAGEVTYEWVEGDMVDIGKYKALIWVDGPFRHASDLIIYEVYDGPGPTPT